MVRHPWNTRVLIHARTVLLEAAQLGAAPRANSPNLRGGEQPRNRSYHFSRRRIGS